MNDRPPQRRGLGRGLGSLIPTGPLVTEQRREGQAESAPAAAPDVPPAASAVATDAVSEVADPPAVPGTADWIGRIPPPPGVDSPRIPGVPGIPGTAVLAASGTVPSSATAAAGGEDTELQPVGGASFAEIPVSSISPNPRQPRQVFDEDAMAELVHSIEQVGLLQPVVVRSTGAGHYELIMGERRLRASRQAGLEVIPAIVRDTDDDALLRDALLENLHRAELNPLEEAAAYQQLLDDFGCTHEELAARIGRSRPQISNTLRLLKLSPAVQRRVASGVLSAGHARALLGVPDSDAQDRLAGRVVAEGISVRGLEELVAVGELGTARKPTRQRAETSPELGELAGRLSDLFDTSVKVDVGRKKGRLTIEFASVEDLQRIVGLMEHRRSD